MKQNLTTFLAILSSAGLASAASISVNFNSDREDAALSLGESAGAPGYVTAGWNNFNGIPSATGPYTQTTADVDSPIAGSLSDNSGTMVGTTISWTANNSWNTSNGVSNPDNKLMNGYIDNSGANPAIPISITGVPYANYTVVAYFGSDGNNRTGTVGISGGSTFSYQTDSQLGGTFPGSYLQTTDTGAGNPLANYAVWENQTAADFTLTINRGNNNSGFHGFQIIQVPEPSLSALVVACGLLLILRRQRR